LPAQSGLGFSLSLSKRFVDSLVAKEDAFQGLGNGVVYFASIRTPIGYSGIGQQTASSNSLIIRVDN